MTAAAVRQDMTRHHDHIAQAVMVVDGCDNFAIMTSGHILIAKRGLKSINLILIILKARHLFIYTVITLILLADPPASF